MKFDPEHFWSFCAAGQISTKEKGLIPFDKPNGCQRYFIERLVKAIADNRHILVCLKSRQQGISTIMLVLDLFWIFTNPSMESTIIVPDEKLREKFRTDIETFYSGLPKKWRNKMEENNRNQMVFTTPDGESAKFVWQIASDRATGKLGKGLGVTYMHGTEIPLWGVDVDAFANLQASFAEKNPNRLFVYESTAKGYDLFKDLWDTAKDSVGQEAIFIPWWLHEDYTFPEDSNEFRTYFGEPLASPVWRRLSAEELELWQRAKKEYDYEPTPGQIAWMRYQIAEKCGDDINIFLENYPITEEDAFRVTGSQFFPNNKLRAMIESARALPYESYHVKFGRDLEDTVVEPCNRRVATIRVWEPPVEGAAKAGTYYTLGADPAYGSSEWADQFCISINRCYADRTEQVAEFRTPNCTPTHFAWMVCYLAGWYDNTVVNLELNGPGQVVYQELEAMRMLAGLSPNKAERKSYADVLRHIYQYRYFKYNGANLIRTCRHWTSTTDGKMRMFSSLRDGVARGIVEIKSVETIEEMRGVVTDGVSVGADGRRKDDGVVAAGLAHVAWVDNLRSKLIKLGATKKMAVERAKKEAQPMSSMLITRFLKERGITARH